MVTDTFLISFSCKCVADLFLCMSVYADGSICLDILQNRWSPTYDVSSILTSIQVGRVSLPFHTFKFTVKHDDSIQGHPKYLSWLFNLQDVNIFIISLPFFLSRSHCWTSQTPTAQPTVRPHSSIRKTRESTRRGWRPSWSRAGWMSELLLLSALLSITHSSPSKYFSLSFLPHREKKSRKKKTQQLYQKNLSATLGGGRKNNQTRMDITLLANAF